MNVLGATIVAGLIGVAAGCGDSFVTPGPLPPLTTLPPPVQPRATLAIEDPYINARPASLFPGKFEIEVRFRLRETGYSSGATIQSIYVTGEMRDGVCTQGLYVPSGGVLDTFYTDAGIASLGYCSTYLGIVDTAIPPFSVSITVTFVDDDGRQGIVAAAAVPR